MTSWALTFAHVVLGLVIGFFGSLFYLRDRKPRCEELLTYAEDRYTLWVCDKPKGHDGPHHCDDRWWKS